MTLDAPVILLAGGLGTRLRSAVPDLPKVLAPAAGRPFLAWLLADLARQGARRVVLSLGQGAGQVLDALPACRPTGLAVESVVEAEPLGTGGALCHAVDSLALGGTLFVLNGDTWLEEGLASLAALPGGPAALLGLTEVADTTRYGRVTLDAGGRIARFSEKGAVGPGPISAGILRLEAALLREAPSGPFGLEQDLLAHLASSGRLHGALLPGSFVDIGVPADYKVFCALAETALIARYP
ncbi:MAG: sugar phosphate nucleotidyltransferase [Kiloniellales bacterium]